VRRLSGEGNVLTPTSRGSRVPRSILLDRYRVTWLAGLTAFGTQRLTNARTSADVVVRRSNRDLPAGTDSVSTSANRVTRALTPLGLVSLAPPVVIG
jgi:hypothetical protein